MGYVRYYLAPKIEDDDANWEVKRQFTLHLLNRDNYEGKLTAFCTKSHSAKGCHVFFLCFPFTNPSLKLRSWKLPINCFTTFHFSFSLAESCFSGKTSSAICVNDLLFHDVLSSEENVICFEPLGRNEWPYEATPSVAKAVWSNHLTRWCTTCCHFERNWTCEWNKARLTHECCLLSTLQKNNFHATTTTFLLWTVTRKDH